jgi:hypothetical protein
MNALHERLAVRLVGLGGPGAEVARVLLVVVADHHVDPGRAGEVEAGSGVAEDLVEVRRHAPAFAIAVQQPERERRAAQHVGVERLGAKPCGQFL